MRKEYEKGMKESVKIKHLAIMGKRLGVDAHEMLLSGITREHLLTEFLSELITDEGAMPIPVVGKMEKIINYRTGICKNCKWHPDVCIHCKQSVKMDNDIDKELEKVSKKQKRWWKRGK